MILKVNSWLFPAANFDCLDYWTGIEISGEIKGDIVLLAGDGGERLFDTAQAIGGEPHVTGAAFQIQAVFTFRGCPERGVDVVDVLQSDRPTLDGSRARGNILEARRIYGGLLKAAVDDQVGRRLGSGNYHRDEE